MSIRSVQTSFTASAHAHARPALSNTVNLPSWSSHHPAHRHSPTSSAGSQEKRSSPPGLNHHHEPKPTHGRRRSGSFSYLPGNSYESANIDGASAAGATNATTAAVTSGNAAQAAASAAANRDRPRPGLSRLPYAGARSRMPYAYSAPQRRAASSAASTPTKFESLPLEDFVKDAYASKPASASERPAKAVSAPVSRAASPTPPAPAATHTNNGSSMVTLNKDACARLVAGILLNRIHAVGKPMRRYQPQPQQCGMKGYSKSSLSNVLTVEVL